MAHQEANHSNHSGHPDHDSHHDSHHDPHHDPHHDSHHDSHHDPHHDSHHDPHHDSHHDSHHGSHHQTRHFSDQERNLLGYPKNTWNECTDPMLDYISCVKNKAKDGFPFRYIWTVHWADRWSCAHENHALKECDVQRMLRIFEENKAEINTRS